MIATEEEARAFCAGLCDADAIARLERFIVMLAEENERQNLISGKSLEFVWQRHIADSLQLLTHVPRETSPWLDLGSGAGMPGLVLAIARPDLEMHLVESRKKRVVWLQSVIDHFGLKNCTVHGSRLESVETSPMRVITARAFAPLGKLLSLSARFSTQETVWLLPKGRSAGQELSEQPESVRSMFHVEQSATDPQAGIVVGQGRPPIR
ncbi:16S rRNA (guanine(527)-N(7))-methyltransferase RsmG [Alteraurantiacibacter aquimixticola]|uniref:Ribosomal RNA small subunit methyltransferase G n=1 Tax=Alteraurantiacibacter aquimixticola TaxID=2489173 RepID=A0A4T3EXF2_9SPHN|nr:16S rRNA (guanine(527)-N(7))-methyltransferase RsmG [Alteraurantiacibacter aquimixticola]TIX49148.1 16S rRNA (guanine(527)-N(7))-methyltransferase RsmG [Alteraurantiacibacter aquimixticola]